MKIVEYLGHLTAGGAESVIKDYSIELKKRNYEVLIPIYYNTPNSPIQKMVEKEGIKIDVIRGTRTNSFFSRAYYKLYDILHCNARYLKKMIISFQPNVIHLHGYTLIDFEKIGGSMLKGIKLFYTCHNPPKEFFEGRWKKQFEIAKILIKENNLQMIALHKAMADELNDLFGITNTVVLRNPVDYKRFQVDAIKSSEVKKTLGIPLDAVVLGNVGRFDYQKNQLFLIDIFKSFLQYNSNSFLLLIGQSSNGPQYKQIVDKILSLGLQNKCKILFDRSDMPELYSVMDCFVMPSRFEGFCIAFVEAQIARRKCVITSAIPSEAIISNNVVQLSVETDDADVWAKTIYDSVVGCGNEDSNDIGKDFDIKNIVDRLLELYRK